MASSFLTLTNKLLVRFNEVELTSTDFGNAKGVHSLAKQAINSACNKIYQQDWLWPFNYVSDTADNEITCVVGDQIYDFPTDAEVVDLDNIHIERDYTLTRDQDAVQLRRIGHDTWKQRYRATDLNATVAADYGVPKFVFRTPGGKIGISPRPDQAYTLLVPYWTIPDELSTFSDISTIPTRFDDVILDIAKYYMHDMRKNFEQMSAAEKDADKAIKRMRKILINDNDQMEDTRVNR